ncbi:MAG: polysaccharide pyruvyl transferase family protein [Candidatus Berkelbacteria bacterium]|nr:polysaccharide pyruvyl transferase family protein [Candidatus Berkelbacteria bacterium]
MKYSWASITESCENFGNILIEYNLKKILARQGVISDNAEFVFDAFKAQDDSAMEKINETEFLIVPGCTTLVVDDYPGIKSVLPKLKVKVFNIGAALASDRTMESFGLVKKYFEPIGTRDPFSHKFLNGKGIKSTFVGCPTLFSGSAKNYSFRQSNKVTFVFGARNFEEQVAVLKRLLSAGYDVSVVLQDKLQIEKIQALPVRKIVYSPQRLISELEHSRATVTGRLHAALPSLACGTPVFFIKSFDDTRFSLLEYLDIRLFDIGSVNLEEKAISQVRDFKFCRASTYKKIEELRGALIKYQDLVKTELR